MSQYWSVQNHCLDIKSMPFYWRLSDVKSSMTGIDSCLDIRITRDEEMDYLKFEPNVHQWEVIEAAYRQNANIGFLNPESGQLNTYGTSVNKFFLAAVKTYKPERIYEIGCGAGFSIRFLKEHGWKVTGIDPSEYSLHWSQRAGFDLINGFFDENTLDVEADFVYCNDVFEHVRHAGHFSKTVYKALAAGGVFCIATTNSTESIAIGDISMLEHQHVNMFTERSIYLILREAGFSEVIISKGTYGNTLHIIAVKGSHPVSHELPPELTVNFFEKSASVIENFECLYKDRSIINGYVPLRCIPYLATVGIRGECSLFDSNRSWRGKYIDGYSSSIKSFEDVVSGNDSVFFIGSMTFYHEIKKMLLSRGILENQALWVGDIS